MRLTVLLFALGAAVPGAAQPRVELAHDLDSDRALALVLLVERFNRESGKAGSVAVEKGNTETGTPGARMILLANDEARDLIAGRRIVPLQGFVAAQGRKIDTRRIYPALRDAVADGRGEPRALPMAYTLPVLYFNRDLLARAGVDTERVPRTWWKLQEAAGALYDAGVSCPYTSSWPVWVHLENASTQHNEPFMSGAGSALRLRFNSLVHVKHLALLSSWFKSKYFRLYGDANEADATFASGECAMLTSGSDLYSRLRNRTEFALGVAELPYYDDVYGGSPTNVVPHGGSLWVMAGGDRAERRLAADFISFLMRPAIQREWAEASGYLPVTDAAGVTTVAGMDKPPSVFLARAISERRSLAELRFQDGAGYARLANILHEELGTIWANVKPPKEALDAAVARGTEALNGGPRREPAKP